MDLKIAAVASGVVEGERGTRGNAVPLNIFLGTPFPKSCQDKGNGNTVIHYSVPPNRLAKKCKVYCKS